MSEYIQSVDALLHENGLTVQDFDLRMEDFNGTTDNKIWKTDKDGMAYILMKIGQRVVLLPLLVAVQNPTTIEKALLNTVLQ